MTNTEDVLSYLERMGILGALYANSSFWSLNLLNETAESIRKLARKRRIDSLRIDSRI